MDHVYFASKGCLKASQGKARHYIHFCYVKWQLWQSLHSLRGWEEEVSVSLSPTSVIPPKLPEAAISFQVAFCISLEMQTAQILSGP